MSPVKILSIDFDYFQIVERETLINCYPSQIERSPEMSIFAWKEVEWSKVSKVSFNRVEGDLLKELLLKQEQVRKIMVACSHADIYPFIEEEIRDKDVLLYNIDMHHDMFNSCNGEYSRHLNCGNWVQYVDRASKETKYYWVQHPLSDEGYKYHFKEAVEKSGAIFLSSVKDIVDCDFDYIFLCRSDSWVPPNLDLSFQEIVSWLKGIDCPLFYEKELDFNRAAALVQKEYPPHVLYIEDFKFAVCVETFNVDLCFGKRSMYEHITQSLCNTSFGYDKFCIPYYSRVPIKKRLKNFLKEHYSGEDFDFEALIYYITEGIFVDEEEDVFMTDVFFIPDKNPSRVSIRHAKMPYCRFCIGVLFDTNKLFDYAVKKVYGKIRDRWTVLNSSD